MATKSKIQDQTFLFTGTLSEFTREEAEALVETNGGKVLSGVSAKLNYLIVGADAGSKLDKAKALGTVKILTEKEFLKMVPKTTANKTDDKDTEKNKKTVVKKAVSPKKTEPAKTSTKKVVTADNSTSIEEVTIGNQVWMAKNLDVAHFRNGDPISEAKSVEDWVKAGEKEIPAWCYYDNDSRNGNKYGKLYNWFAVTDSRILAPEGYHVPSHEEWVTLLANLGGDFSAGGKMKEKGTKNWNSPNSKATNQSNFSALPGGYCFAEDGFLGVTEKASFWSKSEFNSNLAKERSLINSAGSVILSYRDKRQGSSVRCIKDADELVKGIRLGSLEIYKCDIGSFSFNDAKLECEKIGGGWRVPTKDELNILFENKESIGQFTDGFYWSSTKDESSVSFAWGQRFEDGFQNICSSTAKFKNFIRPVRSI